MLWKAHFLLYSSMFFIIFLESLLPSISSWFSIWVHSGTLWGVVKNINGWSHPWASWLSWSEVSPGHRCGSNGRTSYAKSYIPAPFLWPRDPCQRTPPLSLSLSFSHISSGQKHLEKDDGASCRTSLWGWRLHTEDSKGSRAVTEFARGSGKPVITLGLPFLPSP